MMDDRPPHPEGKPENMTEAEWRQYLRQRRDYEREAVDKRSAKEMAAEIMRLADEYAVSRCQRAHSRGEVAFKKACRVVNKTERQLRAAVDAMMDRYRAAAAMAKETE